MTTDRMRGVADTEREALQAQLAATQSMLNEFDDDIGAVQAERDGLRAQLAFVMETLDQFGRHDTGKPKDFWALFDVLDSGLALRAAVLSDDGSEK